MDYEKKYKEALDRARIYRDNAKAVEEYSAVARYENIFPELRENEDEKIRKALIDALKVSETIGELKFRIPYPTREECIAYLEKQKDLDNMVIVSPEVWEGAINDSYENGKKDGEKQKEPEVQVFCEAKAYDLGYEQGKEDAKKEQKPAWSDEDEKKIHFLVRMIELYIKDDKYCFGENNRMLSKQEIIEMLKSLCPQPKQEWSEVENRYLDDVENVIRLCIGAKGYGYPDEYLKELAFFIHTIKCKRNQIEWSEEDAKMLDAMIDIVSGSFYEPLCPRKEMLAWLKSLRPQPSWKPSEEQIDALKELIDDANRAGWVTPGATELYEQLKKL